MALSQLAVTSLSFPRAAIVKQREVNSIQNLIELSSSLWIEGSTHYYQEIERDCQILATWVLIF